MQEAGKRQFLGHGIAANYVPGFKYEARESRLCQVGSCNQAIMIRTFLSKENTLTYQAGGGIVAASNPAGEMQEVKNKLGALKKAIELAETIC